MSIQEFYLHVDLDAFFASVEQLDNPQYRGKPVIVGGDPKKRGVVSTCSYEARKFGVHSAMPMAKAVLLCPQGIIIPGRMERYYEKSCEVMNIFNNYSPSVQQISIDEAFIEITGTEKLFGKPNELALNLKKTVFEETGLKVSVGLATNRYIAKIASGRLKPDGFCFVEPGLEYDFIQSLLLKDLWGIGEKTRLRLEAAGLKTIKDLSTCSLGLLKNLLGEAGGAFLFTVLQGKDPGIFNEQPHTRSISSEQTFAEDLYNMQDIEKALLEISEELMFRIRKEKMFGKTVHVKIRYQDFRTVSIQESQVDSIQNASELFELSKKLFLKKYEKGNTIRLLGISLGTISPVFSKQEDLFSNQIDEKKSKVEKALYDLSEKRGKRVATKARLLNNNKK